MLNFAPYLTEVKMEKILTSRAVAVSEFKRAPNEIVAEANGEPIAVLTNNRPSFYVISPSAYEELLEKIWEIEVTPTLVKRLDDLRTGKTKSVEVTLKDLVK
ncbi:MAG: type II toxin-antitoxin system prevent-host-death family antitoxin [Actinobacteria bacterium]|nr:type II toxin-antitoxin system prevent-host-death family antitoxin [Actinomycetota bacterium]NDB50260.1 type II toxin-antitoxin system prevent-host-death family antitoxin [Actinomycetota bacterium]NDE48120.1 type II toxin-antitoxin system prevent-host-death family antitoxin [Actinomycetota bacterium]NDE96176.1 type II toxin-antitoxin system prevent-host-death family antitoxin [Actinomycetota bacterium]NDG09266.1 type II toxin-antitoxin system prevent-host-death family antitoxin [Actinomyceto